MPLRVYFDTEPKKNASSNSAAEPASSENWKAILEQHQQNKIALSFFRISGAKDEEAERYPVPAAPAAAGLRPAGPG